MTVALPPPLGAPYDESIPVERNEGYRLRRVRALYDLVAGDQRKRDHELVGPGDTVQVIEVIGPDKLAIATQLKGRRYPFIPIEEGSIITRPFDRIWVRVLSSTQKLFGTGFSPPTEALLLTSFGRAITPPREKSTGLFAGFASAKGTATATGVDLFRTAFELGTNTWSAMIGLGIRPAFLKYGGLLRVKNLSAGTLFLYFGVPGAFTFGSNADSVFSERSSWWIDSGATEEIRAEGLLSFRSHPDQSVTPVVDDNNTTCIATQAGPGDYLVMLNRLMVDGSDLESGNHVGTVTRLED
jgi:hypothetical protein